MICGGAAEQAMAQWASLFAETGLGVSKSTGDLLGPCVFAVLMGCSRLFYGVKGQKINLEKALAVSALGCVAGYLIAGISPNPYLALAGCGICGLSVGLLWPGILSLGPKYFSAGGVAMFAYLALAGDLGCISGPGITGVVAGMVGGNLQTGFFVALIFPVVLLAGIGILVHKGAKKE